MLQYFFGHNNWIEAIGALFAFGLTIAITYALKDKLPSDRGKEFAVDGEKSKGKPQGAGLFFILVFIGSSLIFAPFSIENTVFLILIGLCMITGFLDDRAKNPWGRVKKGMLDLTIAVLTAVNYIYFNGSEVTFRLFGNAQVYFNPILLGAIIVALVWGMINVTNCADGVDGLSGTLTIITLLTIYTLFDIDGLSDNGYFIILFIACLLAYLLFNATPSILMMGDAGSRAMGIFIAIAIVKTGSLFLCPIVALVLILDGGLGLIKVALIKTIKVHIMKNIRTPLHDQVRKVNNWSNTQCVYRFAVIQAIINIVLLMCLRSM